MLVIVIDLDLADGHGRSVRCRDQRAINLRLHTVAQGASADRGRAAVIHRDAVQAESVAGQVADDALNFLGPV